MQVFLVSVNKFMQHKLVDYVQPIVLKIKKMAKHLDFFFLLRILKLFPSL